MRLIHIIALLLAVLCGPAMAGENVPLLDANGNPLKPSQMDTANIARSCGDCHDVKANATSVHFNRGAGSADAEASNCLACHMPEKGAFNADGTVKKLTSEVSDEACLTCHGDIGLTARHPGKAHDGMTCIDCHKDAGHEKTGAASCKGCHFGGKMKKPSHPGLPGLHLKRIACETCHITKSASGANLGFVRKNGKIVPVDENGAPVHHGAADPADGILGCCGEYGCADCHSSRSRFFFGTTTTTDANGGTVKLANWKSMGADRNQIRISIVRESFVKRYGGWLVVLVLAFSVGHYLVFGPHKVHENEDDPEVQRFTLYERLIHWLAILFCTFLSVTGIMFLLHKESSAGIMRTLHGQVGAAFVLVLIALAMTWWRHAVFTRCDKEWVCKLGGYLWIKADCPAGKFNAGQKAFFWMVAVFGGIVIGGTGIWLIAGRGDAPSWAYALHDVAAIAFMAGIVGHIYLGVFANPGTIMSIITGRVKRSWAEKHHSEWAQKMRGE